MTSPAAAPSFPPSPSTGELVSLVAGLMALNALAIDLMLPALGEIARDLGVTNPNDRQLVIVAYVLGFGLPQIAFGPLTDRLGRRRVLFASIFGYSLAGLACMAAETFPQLLVMRFVQGVFAAGCRVVAVAIVRDVYQGRGMARIMSLVMTVFMVIPILAPALGQVVLFVAPWRWCFGVLTIAGGLMGAWVFIRLPETLPTERRASLGLRPVLSAYAQVFRTRVAFGYMLASGIAFSALFTFISACEQIFRDVFHVEETFALYFALIALALSFANFTNARLVVRFGMRRLSHLALFGFTLSSLVLLVATLVFGDHLWLFMPLFALCFACFGLLGANFNALAMEPLGAIAGTASAVYGFATTTLSGVLGGLIARAFDGTTLPLLTGYVALGLGSIVVVAFTERGRLFDRAPAPAPT